MPDNTRSWDCHCRSSDVTSMLSKSAQGEQFMLRLGLWSWIEPIWLFSLLFLILLCFCAGLLIGIGFLDHCLAGWGSLGCDYAWKCTTDLLIKLAQGHRKLSLLLHGLLSQCKYHDRLGFLSYRQHIHFLPDILPLAFEARLPHTKSIHHRVRWIKVSCHSLPHWHIFSFLRGRQFWYCPYLFLIIICAYNHILFFLSCCCFINLARYSSYSLLNISSASLRTAFLPFDRFLLYSIIS